MKIFLVRHGITDWNQQGKIQGHLDPVLNKIGVQQANQAKITLQNINIDEIYSSDSLRAFQTAEIIDEVQEATIHPDKRLRERFYGDWQGLTWDEIRVLYPEKVAKMKLDPINTNPTAGESLKEVFVRVESFFQDKILKEKGSPKSITIVSHNTPIRILLLLVQGMNLSKIEEIDHIPNALPIKVDFSPDLRMKPIIQQRNWKKLDHHEKII